MRQAALFLVVILLGTQAAEAKPPAVGKLHPEIRLPTIDGTASVSLRALAGKRVLLLQFASW